MKKIVAVAAALLLLAGCSQFNSFLDGWTGRPINEGGYVDNPECYHAGALMFPVGSQVLALLRLVLPLLLPLL